MRKLLFAPPLALALLAGSLASGPAMAQELTTPQARASYAIGQNIGASMREDGVPLDEAAFLRGLRDALSRARPAMTEAEMDQALAALQVELATKAVEARAKAAEANLAAGQAFLADNGKKPGVVTTESGLQYQVITTGTGPRPAATDTVLTRYRGTLIDGAEFDSSGETPVDFPVNRVIPGWTEALQLMPVGSKWRVFVPSNLAYGPRGAGAEIGPNATLVFEIELLGIQ